MPQYLLLNRSFYIDQIKYGHNFAKTELFCHTCVVNKTANLEMSDFFFLHRIEKKS